MSCNVSLWGRPETIVHSVAGLLPIGNRIVSVPSRGRL
jgi:hypothetical protein